MKRNRTLLLLLLCLSVVVAFSLNGCGEKAATESLEVKSISQREVSFEQSCEADSSHSSANQSEAEGSTSSYSEETNEQYYDLIDPLFCAGITYNSWDNAEQISVDKLSTFYLVKYLSETYPDTGVAITVSAKDVETFIQSYFDVSTEYLRKADNFDKDSQTYLFGYGVGGGATFEITDVQKDSQILTIFLNYITADKPFRKSELKIDLSDGIRYLSCKAEDIG